MPTEVCLLVSSLVTPENLEFSLTFARIKEELGLPRKDSAYPLLRKMCRAGILQLVSKGRGCKGATRYRVLNYGKLLREASRARMSSGTSKEGTSSTPMTFTPSPRWDLRESDLESGDTLREAYRRWCAASGEPYSDGRLLQIAAMLMKARAVAHNVVRFVARAVRSGISYVTQRLEDMASKFLRPATTPDRLPTGFLSKMMSKFSLAEEPPARLPDPMERRRAMAAAELEQLELKAGALLRRRKLLMES